MRALALLLAITSAAAQEERTYETDEALVLVQARAVWEKKPAPVKKTVPVDAASELVTNIWSALKADADGKAMLAELEKHQFCKTPIREVLRDLVHAFDIGFDAKDSVATVLQQHGVDPGQLAAIVPRLKTLDVIVKRKMGEQLSEFLKADDESAAVLAELEKLKELPEATIFMLLSDVGQAYRSGVSIGKDDVEHFLSGKGFDQEQIDAVVPQLQQLDVIAKRLLHHRQEDNKREDKIWSALSADVLGKPLLAELKESKLCEPSIRKVVRDAIHAFGTGADDPPTTEGVKQFLRKEGFTKNQMDAVVPHLQMLDLIVKKLLHHRQEADTTTASPDKLEDKIWSAVKADVSGKDLLDDLKNDGLPEPSIRKVVRGAIDAFATGAGDPTKEDVEQFSRTEGFDKNQMDAVVQHLQMLVLTVKSHIGELVFALLKADVKGASKLNELKRNGLSEATIHKLLRKVGHTDNAGVDNANTRNDDVDQFLLNEGLNQAKIKFVRSQLQELDVIAKRLIRGQAL